MLSYIGGKSRISGQLIIPNIPNDIETYIEPFSGMFWTFFKMDLKKYPNLKKVVYNDFNPLNVNLFNCVKEHEDFHSVITNIESQKRDLFEEYQSQIFDPHFTVDLSEPDFETGYKYAYIVSQVWSGTNPSTGKFIDLKGKYKSKFDSFKDKLLSENWKEHFNKIDVVENMDFEDVIKKYDSKSTYIYLDPPYYKCEEYYANHDFNISSHERLANTLHGVEGKFSLSYYYFDELKDWYPKDEYNWVQKDFYKAAAAKKGIDQNKGTELLIMNYGL